MWAVTTSREEGVTRVAVFSEMENAQEERAKELIRDVFRGGSWEDFDPGVRDKLWRHAARKDWAAFAELLQEYNDLVQLDVQVVEITTAPLGPVVTNLGPPGSELKPVQTARFRNRVRRAFQYAIDQMREIGEDGLVRELRALRRTLPRPRSGLDWDLGALLCLLDALVTCAHKGGDVPLWNQGGQGYEAIRALKLYTKEDRARVRFAPPVDASIFAPQPEATDFGGSCGNYLTDDERAASDACPHCGGQRLPDPPLSHKDPNDE